jgi:hypothetical protein
MDRMYPKIEELDAGYAIAGKPSMFAREGEELDPAVTPIGTGLDQRFPNESRPTLYMIELLPALTYAIAGFPFITATSYRIDENGKFNVDGDQVVPF